MTDPALVEEVARALASASQTRASGIPDFDDLQEYTQQSFRVLAEAALSVVRKRLETPTEEMRQVVAANWGHRTWREYGEVLSASPLYRRG